MGLGLFLIPTLGGYWFLTHLNYTRYGAVRVLGYHVLFKSAIAGGLLFAVAHLVILSLNYCIPQIGATWDSFMPAQYSDTAALSVLLGLTLPYVGNYLYGNEKGARRAATESGDLIELLIAESIDARQPIELSLRSGKSYIGLALESGIKRVGESDVSLVPMASGYRNKDTQELEITTNYAPVIEELLKGSSHIAHKDFQIIIPMSEIVSARIFHPDAYERFRGRRNRNRQR